MSSESNNNKPIICVSGGVAEVVSGAAVVIDLDTCEQGLSSIQCRANLELAESNGAPAWLENILQEGLLTVNKT